MRVPPEYRKRREKEVKGAFSLPFPSVAGSDNSCNAKKRRKKNRNKIFFSRETEKKKNQKLSKDDENRWGELVICLAACSHSKC
jgi:hypothetical protein